MQLNYLVLALAALIPLIMGFIYYNPKVVGNAWMKEAGLDEEKMKNANMALIFGLCYLFSFMFATAINMMVVHQNHMASILLNEPGFKEKTGDVFTMYTDFMAKYGHNFRTFKHGAFHGTLTGLFVALPLVAINGMFERRSFKYVLIHVGYWTITIALMGGVICQWG
jgi:hypothetical protein